MLACLRGSRLEPSTELITPLSTQDKNERVPGSTSEIAKQGAYGKVKTHSEPLLAQLSHIDEVLTAVAYKLGLSGVKQPEPLGRDAPPHYRFCEDMLKKTSRSFCLVIQQLPWPLRKAVCVFYLVLRGLGKRGLARYAVAKNSTLSPARSVWCTQTLWRMVRRTNLTT